MQRERDATSHTTMEIHKTHADRRASVFGTESTGRLPKEHPHFLAPVYERRKTSREVMKQAPRACVSIPRACVRLCIQRSGSG